MRVLVACEFSGRVRNEFRALGHDAWSCDIIPAKDRSPFHIQADVRELLSDDWDLMIAFPPCTHLAVSGAAHFHKKPLRQARALDFVQLLMDAPIHRIAIENPIGVISTRIRKPDQIIQPWQFGHGEVKSTCLWLKNLPKLEPTWICRGRRQRTLEFSPSPDRGRLRSVTYRGVARAMASQWG